MAKQTHNLLGGWAFLIGVLLALVLSFVSSMDSRWNAVLLVIGLIIGFLNVKGSEVQPFMMSGAVLIIASWFGVDVIQTTIPFIGDMLNKLLIVFVPAVIVVSIRNVFMISRN